MDLLNKLIENHIIVPFAAVIPASEFQKQAILRSMARANEIPKAKAALSSSRLVEYESSGNTHEIRRESISEMMIFRRASQIQTAILSENKYRRRATQHPNHNGLFVCVENAQHGSPNFMDDLNPSKKLPAAFSGPLNLRRSYVPVHSLARFGQASERRVRKVLHNGSQDIAGCEDWKHFDWNV